MQIVLIIIIAVLILLALFKESGFDKERRFPYRLKQFFFNQSETALFFELKKSLGDKYHIFPKVRIIDFIEPTDRDPKWRNKIWAKHIDFLICDEYFEPVLGIELNGKSHLSQVRKDSDEFKKKVFYQSNLPFEVIEVGTSFNLVLKDLKIKLIK